MAHHTARGAYHLLVDRLNAFPQGAPPSELLYRILELLFSEREAALVAQLPIRPFTAARAARIWDIPAAQAAAALDELAGRAVLLDYEAAGVRRWVLPPPMAGFFEFSMMRVRGDVDQKLLSELFYQYITVEDEFIRELFTHGETRLGRAFVNEDALPPELSLHVLDHERASEVIRTTAPMGVSLCYCRHKAQHVGRACDAPLDICMTFGATAASLIRHGFARRVEVSEGLDLLAAARERRLVQFGENVRRDVSFICNCCGCCCEAMIAARRFGWLHPVHTTNYLPVFDAERCRGCGTCVNACPVEAVALVSANDPHRPKARRARLDEGLCIGCGVCARACPREAIALRERAARVLTPLDTTHRVVLMAIERGTLANLVFDTRSAGHRALGAILGVILRLPPLKQALASQQVRSRYLERLLELRSRPPAPEPGAPSRA
jgi:formate hydrogenlyase subunit 6/NADH:ubiquinone oxidoreductase subunit I